MFCPVIKTLSKRTTRRRRNKISPSFVARANTIIYVNIICHFGDYSAYERIRKTLLNMIASANVNC